MIAAALAWMQIPPRQPARAVPLGRYRAISSGSVARISAVGFALGRVSCRNGQEGTPKAARNAAGARRRRRHPRAGNAAAGITGARGAMAHDPGGVRGRHRGKDRSAA